MIFEFGSSGISLPSVLEPRAAFLDVLLNPSYNTALKQILQYLIKATFYFYRQRHRVDRREVGDRREIFTCLKRFI